MRWTRVFHSGNLSLSSSIVLDERAYHHLVNVLRLKTGSQFIIFNGEGGQYRAELFVEKKIAFAQLLEYQEIDSESQLSIHLIQGICRGEKMEWCIEKAVELGVSEITPIFTEYCDIKVDEQRLAKKMQHWRYLIISASEQSGREKIPILHSPRSFNQCIRDLENHSGLKFLLHPFDSPSSMISNMTSMPAEIGLIVGPEGGFHAKEVELAKNSQISILNLGPRVLRTETAGLAAISVFQSLWGDFKVS